MIALIVLMAGWGSFPVSASPGVERGMYQVGDNQASRITAVEFDSSFNSDNFSDELVFEVPSGATSMQIEVYASDLSAVPLVADLVRLGTDGGVVETLISHVVAQGSDPALVRNAASFSKEPGPYLSPNRSIGGLMGYASAVVPNNPGVALTPGAWRARIKDLTGGLSDRGFKMRVLFRIPETAARKKILPLNLYFTGAGGWTTKTYRSNRVDIKAFFNALAVIFANAGIELRIASVADIGDASKEPEKFKISTGEKLNELFRSGGAKNGVKLFFVQSVLGGVGGISSGIGGPKVSANYPFGGIALSEAYTSYPTIFSIITAHELGHYLGLYHDKEYGTLLFDQIPDTTDNGVPPNVMDAQASNTPDQVREFTPQQSAVMSRHPAIIEIP
ncbi:MAG: hypothetical protein WCW52_03240 [Elusimicrobiales bacterium]